MVGALFKVIDPLRVGIASLPHVPQETLRELGRSPATGSTGCTERGAGEMSNDVLDSHRSLLATIDERAADRTTSDT